MSILVRTGNGINDISHVNSLNVGGGQRVWTSNQQWTTTSGGGRITVGIELEAE